MTEKAKGRPLILINPQLEDKPSGNNIMQVSGRSERRAIMDSFVDIYGLRLLYPSNGGFMYPIKGILAKKEFHSPWVVYNKEEDCSKPGRQSKCAEVYKIVAAFDPHKPPSSSVISSLFFN